MNLANQLTVLRIFLVPIFIVALFYHSPERPLMHTVAIGVFVAACLSDALDGYLARRLGQKTLLGSYIDPLADKLLLLTGFLSLSLMHHLPAAMKIPVWVTIPVISRDVIILIGSALIFILTGSLKAKPLFVGKLTTFTQMLALLGALAMWPPRILETLFMITVALTILSGLFYLRMGEEMLRA